MTVRRICKTILLFFITTVCCAAAAPAQQRSADIKYQLARNYERGGDFAAAAKLYRELYEGDSLNPNIFESLKRCYLQLKEYDNAVALMETRLVKTPGDVNLLAQLGSAYILKSDEKKAFEIWNVAVAAGPGIELTYQIVGGAMTQSRLFERAIDLYRRGREECGNSSLFTMDIANLHTIMMNYADATREYLSMLRHSPAQIGYVQSSLAGYTARADGLSAATSVVSGAVKTEPDNVVFHHLLAWLYMEGKQFDSAYSVYKFIDAKTGARGNELYNFAERALREKAFESSTKAYKDIMERHPKFNFIAQVKFGYARSLEEAETAGDTLNLFGESDIFTGGKKPVYSNILEAYGRVVQEHKRTEFAARSLLRIALIKYDKLSDLEGARSDLELLTGSYGQFPDVMLDGKLYLGDVYLSGGDLSRAGMEYNAIAEKSPAQSQRRDKALLRLAELDYFAKRYQEAVTKLSALTSNPVSDAVNDAIGLKIFIQENLTPDGEALEEFSRADLLKRQRRFSESLALYESIIKKHADAGITDDALLNAGDLLARTGLYNDAIAKYERILSDFPESIFSDLVLMKEGKIFQLGLNDNQKAVQTFQLLLERFPGSIYINEARRIIRELRGDAI